MNTTRIQTRWLVGIVLAHLSVTLAHGAAHTGARVPLSQAANLFVFIVILAGPLVGLAALRVAPRAAALLVGTTLAGALIFGLLNHFVFRSPDHVTRVEGRWQPIFATTAALLAVTEMIGAGLAVHLSRRELQS